jgi:hypothetical protein
LPDVPLKDKVGVGVGGGVRSRRARTELERLGRVPCLAGVAPALLPVSVAAVTANVVIMTTTAMIVGVITGMIVMF